MRNTTTSRPITLQDIDMELRALGLFYRDQELLDESTRRMLAAMYCEDLQGIIPNARNLHEAITEARRRCKFRPRSADILEAWDEVRRRPSPRSNVPALETDAAQQVRDPANWEPPGGWEHQAAKARELVAKLARGAEA